MTVTGKFDRREYSVAVSKRAVRGICWKWNGLCPHGRLKL